MFQEEYSNYLHMHKDMQLRCCLPIQNMLCVYLC